MGAIPFFLIYFFSFEAPTSGLAGSGTLLALGPEPTNTYYLYIFINSHITKTFRMSFFSQESYQRDCYITFAGKLMPWVHSNNDNFFYNELILMNQTLVVKLSKTKQSVKLLSKSVQYFRRKMWTYISTDRQTRNSKKIFLLFIILFKCPSIHFSQNY